MSKVFVAGAAVMDVIAHAPKHPGTGETIAGSDLGFFPGGKGYNQAIATARLGIPTEFFGKVGKDKFGEELRSFLEIEGVGVERLTECSTPSGAAMITVDPLGRVAVTVCYGANEVYDASLLSEFSPTPSDVLVSSLEIPFATVEEFFARGRASHSLNVLNLAPARETTSTIIELADLIILNAIELAHASDSEISDESTTDAVIAAATRFRRRPSQQVVVTLGAQGALALGETNATIHQGKPVEVVNTLGAGDCFVGALCARVVEGDKLEEAVEFANAASAVSVGREGAGPSMPHNEDVVEMLERFGRPSY